MIIKRLGLCFLTPSLLLKSPSRFSFTNIIRSVNQFSTDTNFHKLQRLYINIPICKGSTIELEPTKLNYIQNVLRFKSGDQIRVFNGIEGEFLATFQNDLPSPSTKNRKHAPRSKKSFIGSLIIEKCIKEQSSCPTTKNNVMLMFGLIKPKQNRLIIEKATELGVTSFQPLITKRVQRVNNNKNDFDEKMKLIAIEASEQSERLTVPTFNHLIELNKEVLELLQFSENRASLPFQALFIAEERSDHTVPILTAISQFKQDFQYVSDYPRVAILIGPEGGWANNEVDDIVKNIDHIFNKGDETCNGGVNIENNLKTKDEANQEITSNETHRCSMVKVYRVSLGAGVLRAETAAIYALSAWNAASQSSTF